MPDRNKGTQQAHPHLLISLQPCNLLLSINSPPPSPFGFLLPIDYFVENLKEPVNQPACPWHVGGELDQPVETEVIMGRIGNFLFTAPKVSVNPGINISFFHHCAKANLIICHQTCNLP